MNDRESLSDTFLALAHRPGPSLGEAPRAAWVRQALEAIGLDVHEDGAGERIGGNQGNLWADMGDGDDRLLLAAHLDTVEPAGGPPLVSVLAGNRITAGDGPIAGADDLCGVSVLITLARELVRAGRPHRPLRLIFFVAEELQARGARHMDDGLLDGLHGAVVLDHGDPTGLVTSGPGKTILRATVQGRGGHGCRPDATVHAGWWLSQVVAALPTGRLDTESVLNLGPITPAWPINVVPDTATACWEVRSHAARRLDAHLASLEETAHGAFKAVPRPADRPPPRLIITREHCYAPWAIGHSHQLVREAKEAITRQTGVATTVVGAGGSDATILNNRGLPAVILGCGMHHIHSNREYADLGEMETALGILRDLAASA